jgi:hypothetical protein
VRLGKLMRLTILLIATGVLSTLVWAQSSPTAQTSSPRQKTPATQQSSVGPSLEETTSWLSERIGEAGISESSSSAIGYGLVSTDNISMGSYHADWSGCKLVLHYIHQRDMRTNDTTDPNGSSETRSTTSATVTVSLSFLSETVGTSEAKPTLPGGSLGKPAWNVDLKARGNEQPFLVHYEASILSSGRSAPPPSQATEDYSWTSFNIEFGSEEIAGRVAKAFSHAIHLCSQKKEPF